ncbi:MAG: hypothetical protein RO009_03165 [Pseudorhodoplanes sp.]|jgi:predicted transcriptional regulator|nr:hypothetical protein [Pseudorhodoplanes sp.]
MSAADVMGKQALVVATALTTAEQSNAIVVSFDAKWHRSLLGGTLGAVIRKRVPKERSFDWLYFHVNSPISAICGRVRIDKITMITLQQAIRLAEQLNLPPDAIAQYVGHDGRVGCYHLGSFQIPSVALHRSTLTERVKYSPPQSFLILSKSAKEIIDAICGFDDVSS